MLKEYHVKVSEFYILPKDKIDFSQLLGLSFCMLFTSLLQSYDLKLSVIDDENYYSTLVTIWLRTYEIIALHIYFKTQDIDLGAGASLHDSDENNHFGAVLKNMFERTSLLFHAKFKQHNRLIIQYFYIVTFPPTTHTHA
jgi:hypothetical protein